MGQHAQFRQLVAVALALLAPAGPAGAQACRIALSLGLDVSSSVDAAEYRLQAEGLAAALTDPEVVAAFTAVPGTVAALQIFEWSGAQQQSEVQGWTLIERAADLERIAAGLRARQRSYSRYATAIGQAMAHGALALQRGPSCWRRTLDLSGDGANNDGAAPAEVRDTALLAGITVNGLVIGVTRALLTIYYRSQVIRGPGAFVETATDHADFSQAMRRKLIRELAVQEMSSVEPH